MVTTTIIYIYIYNTNVQSGRSTRLRRVYRIQLWHHRSVVRSQFLCRQTPPEISLHSTVVARSYESRANWSLITQTYTERKKARERKRKRERERESTITFFFDFNKTFNVVGSYPCLMVHIYSNCYCPMKKTIIPYLIIIHSFFLLSVFSDILYPCIHALTNYYVL